MADKSEMAEDAVITPSDSAVNLRNKDGSVTKLVEEATADISSPEEMAAFFRAQGVPVSTGEEITGDYLVIRGEDAKAVWCAKHVGEHLFVVMWKFADGAGNREFVIMHIIAPDGKFIVMDGGTIGMYGQLRQLSDVRERQNAHSMSDRTAFAGLDVPNGLMVNKPYQYDTRTGKAIPRGVDVPAEFRADAKQTWSFNL